MLRCRKCRRGIIESTCLLTQDEDSDDRRAATCNIWHVNIDSLPEWILNSVNQAHWTVGKLNCQYCSARLGGFNFINCVDCPCGLDATVHLNKSRVDHDSRNRVLIVQPRGMRPDRGRTDLLTDGFQSREQRPEISRTALDGLHQKCVSVISPSSPAVASHPPPGSDNNQSFSFSPLNCISHRRRCSLEEDVAIRSSCFCPAGPLHKSALEMMSAETVESTQSPALFPTSQQFDSDGEAPVNTVTCHSFVSGRMWLPDSPLDQQLLQTVEDTETSPETPDIQQEVSDSALFLRGRSVSGSVAGQDQEEVPQAFPTSLGSNRLNKREKNRLKSLQRKQRRRERWLHSQLELEQAEKVSAPLLDSEEEDKEGLTCAVCLDVYFSPYCCQPCCHVFCEPCLRTIAKNRPANTPCPLCRTLITQTIFSKELNQAAKTFFPKVYCSRKQSFQCAPCAKWPLPSCRKRFRTFWEDRRYAAMAGRRWHFVHGGFTLGALDLTDMRGWLFDIGPVMVYIHSVNWILGLLFLGFLMYYFFF